MALSTYYFHENQGWANPDFCQIQWVWIGFDILSFFNLDLNFAGFLLKSYMDQTVNGTIVTMQSFNHLSPLKP